MNHPVRKIIAVCSLLAVFPAISLALSPASDTLSRSWPSFPSDHVLRFQAHKAVPAGGRIVIDPITDEFSVMAAFDFLSFDLATSSAPGGPFSDRTLGAAAAPGADGVAVIATGTGALALERITIELNSSYGIATGTYVRATIGLGADYGAIGTEQILNASTTGARFIVLETRDAQDRTLERQDVAVVMIEPVSVGSNMIKIRSNGKPDGVLSFGTVQTQMSLNTNYRADCRYSSSAGTAYGLMAGSFTYTGAYFHSSIISGLISGNSYTYYIRCRDQLTVDDDTDYVIQFEISGQEGEEGEESGTPGPGGGGSGGGGGGGSGPERGRETGNYLPYPPLPGLPGVVLSGWGYPGREVTILKDGGEIGKALANANAEFGAFIQDLNQGVYTFSLWTSDLNQNRSSSFSTTFWIDDGTQTTVSGIILPPTMVPGKTELAAGESALISGYGAPGRQIEAWLYPRSSLSPSSADARISRAVIAPDGRYSLAIDTSGLLAGEYYIKAKTIISSVGESGFSPLSTLAIGQALSESGLCQGADLNGDGRVNLTDFSILLYHWGTDDECADQNDDGTVNLTDFSIMMYFWTA